jgi:hypothetical protein
MYCFLYIVSHTWGDDYKESPFFLHASVKNNDGVQLPSNKFIVEFTFYLILLTDSLVVHIIFIKIKGSFSYFAISNSFLALF